MITRFRRGVIAGLSIPLLGLIILAVPVMLAWIVPGSDSVSAASALRAAALALLSGLRGGVVLGGELTTLPPLAVTLLLGWLACGPARRLDSTSGFLGLIAGFALSCLALARWSSLGQTYAPVGRSGVAGALFMLLVGGGARWSPRLWGRLALRHRRVVTAGGAVLAGYVAAAALVVFGQLVLHHSAVSALQAKVAPGPGGLAILLLGVGAAPNAVVAAIGYLTGFGFQVGTNTSVSVRSVSRGPLPDFPVLAALPHSSGLSVGGVILLALSALVAGTIAVTFLKPVGRGWRGLADLASVAALAAVGLAVLGGCARGGVGGAALAGVGVRPWQLGAGAAACVLVGSMTVAVFGWARQSLRRSDSDSDSAPVLSLVSSPATEPAAEPPADAAAEVAADLGDASDSDETPPDILAPDIAAPASGETSAETVSEVRPTG